MQHVSFDSFRMRMRNSTNAQRYSLAKALLLLSYILLFFVFFFLFFYCPFVFVLARSYLICLVGAASDWLRLIIFALFVQLANCYVHEMQILARALWLTVWNITTLLTAAMSRFLLIAFRLLAIVYCYFYCATMRCWQNMIKTKVHTTMLCNRLE